MFWRGKRLQSDEYEKLIKRIITLEAEQDRTRNILESIRSSVSSVRSLVNRKLDGKDLSIEEESPQSGIDDGFNDLRKLNKDKKS